MLKNDHNAKTEELCSTSRNKRRRMGEMRKKKSPIPLSINPSPFSYSPGRSSLKVWWNRNGASTNTGDGRWVGKEVDRTLAKIIIIGMTVRFRFSVSCITE